MNAIGAPAADAVTRTPARRRLSARARKALLTTHIVVSVGLLGDLAAFLAIAVRATATGDPGLADSSYELLAMFSAMFGIPLSFATLGTGIALGLGTKWGVLRYPWVTAKLVLIATVILVGALVLGPAVDQMRTGEGGAETRLILGASWSLGALLLATGLSVFRPGKRRRGSARA